MNSSIDMFFVIGRGRSGTTLLSRILNAHENLSVAAETLVIKNLYSKYRKTEWTKEAVTDFLDDLFLEKRMEYWKIPKGKLLDYLVENGPYESFQDLVKRLYVAFKVFNFGDSDVTKVGDKNPHYSLSIPLIKKIYPGTKFVFIVRNYKDNVASFKRVSFDVDNTAALSYRWKYYNRQVLKEMKKDPSSFLLVRFEDILKDPSEKIGEICTFLGIPYDPEMLEFYKNEKSENREWHKNIKSPLRQDTIGKWKNVLSESEAKVCDLICGSFSQQLGYPVQDTKAGLVDILRSIPGFIYGWFITLLEIRLQLLPFAIRIRIINLYRKIVGVK